MAFGVVSASLDVLRVSLGRLNVKLLVIEDDQQTSQYVVKGLTEEGHTVDAVSDGLEGFELASTRAYDVLIIDRMVPGMDGLSMVKALRRAGMEARVIFLTALGTIDDRVEGLEAGGDDYLLKPFAFSELNARLNALARRPHATTAPTILRVADLEIDIVRRSVVRAGKVIDLQPREFRLLEYMMRNAGRVLTRTMLLERVWDFHFDPKTNVVETHLSRLRTKIDKPFQSRLLRTIRGSGYMLDAPR